MKELNLNIGLERYQMVKGGAPLVFNPKDQNIYARFSSVIDTMNKIEQSAKEETQKITKDTPDSSAQMLRVFENADRRMKEALNGVFGGENDFDKILCGVNLLALTDDGRRVVEVLMEALTPIFRAGAQSYIDEELEKANRNREQRLAL